VFVAERVEHARLQLVLRVSMRGVADHAFFVAELLVEQQRIFPTKTGVIGHVVSPVSSIPDFRT